MEFAMPAIGLNNAVTDVQGLVVGHYPDIDAVCGVTVVICPEGAVAGVDVRGSAPGTRETDLLDPVNLVEKAQAFNELGHAAANCMSRAIISGILSARSLAGMIAFCDFEDR